MSLHSNGVRYTTNITRPANRKSKEHFSHHPRLQRLTCCSPRLTVHSVLQREEIKDYNKMICALDE